MVDWINKEVTRAYERATRAGEARLASAPRASKAYYDSRNARLVVELSNGVILMLPPKLLQGLKDAKAVQHLIELPAGQIGDWHGGASSQI